MCLLILGLPRRTTKRVFYETTNPPPQTVNCSKKNMESEGQQNSSNPSALIASLLSKRAKHHEDLRNIEKQVYDMETAYLQDPSQCGNVLKGYEGFLSASKSTSLYKRTRKFQPEDRLFSLSSVTSPATEEQAAMGAPSGMGPGKPKKGRPGPRDVRRIRQYSEPDFDYEDDPDLI